MEVDISGAKVFFTTPIDVPLLGELQISETLIVSWIVMALNHGNMLLADQRTEGLGIFQKNQAAAELDRGDLRLKFVLGNMG